MTLVDDFDYSISRILKSYWNKINHDNIDECYKSRSIPLIKKFKTSKISNLKSEQNIVQFFNGKISHVSVKNLADVLLPVDAKENIEFNSDGSLIFINPNEDANTNLAISIITFITILAELDMIEYTMQEGNGAVVSMKSAKVNNRHTVGNILYNMTNQEEERNLIKKYYAKNAVQKYDAIVLTTDFFMIIAVAAIAFSIIAATSVAALSALACTAVVAIAGAVFFKNKGRKILKSIEKNMEDMEDFSKELEEDIKVACNTQYNIRQTKPTKQDYKQAALKENDEKAQDSSEAHPSLKDMDIKIDQDINIPDQHSTEQALKENDEKAQDSSEAHPSLKDTDIKKFFKKQRRNSI
ncbi:hypothetical protein CAXC1_320034 [Candidatus Xenohaliotis californiensis]|uniref:Uncharacterized protein n=1 Tax=Candidatus Xenohaliotis californiensis TaxID=84677 RepID=A0ABP0EVH7_9RICK|nr:hypothetical protein CAXC1_320034 [Candidatus Xenohaliotis californiensis]